MDLFSRKIVGWSMSDNIDSSLVQSAMRMSLQYRRPNRGLIRHSDHGFNMQPGLLEVIGRQ